MSHIPPPPRFDGPPPPGPQYPYQPQPKKSSNSVWVVVGILAVVGLCVVVPILAAILFPVLAQSKIAARQTYALSNMKQCATAVVIYQADYDDKFPMEMGQDDALYTSLEPYLKNRDLYYTFDTPTQSNPNLAGTVAYDIADPQGTLMLYKFSDQIDPSAVCAAADSSAKKVTRSDLELEISSNSWRIPGR
ncbi:MAG: hypothetical protein JNM28_08240 [Armatimonadetes bacterium]|nr:hypothetical protein [Armatimonadota bacterium]MBS1712157.1 hypothetical protein [Armatimonadota bacterium]MBX3107865.1 hypothetical protein [Fimbriimonadaceae bacterium]